MDDTLLQEMLESYDGGVAVAEEEGPPPITYSFRVGERDTGPRPVVEVEEEPEPLPVKVENPEDSHFVKNGRELSFDELMAEEDEVLEREKSRLEQVLLNNPRVQVAVGGIIVVTVFTLLALALNFLSGGDQYAPPTPEPTSASKVAQSVTTAPAPSPTEESAAGCSGIQYYHSPDTTDIGPCVDPNDNVVPTGRFGDDGIWLFMILPSGDKKWVEATSYGYTAEQVKAMELKDYKPRAPVSAAPGGGAPIVAEPSGGSGPAPAPVAPVIVPEVPVAPVVPGPTVTPDTTGDKRVSEEPPPVNVRIEPIPGRPGDLKKSSEKEGGGVANGVGDGVGGRP